MSTQDDVDRGPRVSLAPQNDSVSIDQFILKPVVETVESSGSGEIVEYTDQCGYAEADQTSPGSVQHTIEGILYREQIQKVHYLRARGDAVTLTTPIQSTGEGGQIVDSGIGNTLTNLYITDLSYTSKRGNEVFYDESGAERTVFGVQIQLKTSEAIAE